MRAKAFVVVGVVAVVAVCVPAGVSAAGELPDAATCAVCHEDGVKDFMASAHGRAMSRVSKEEADRSCAICHQPSPEHLDDPSAANVRRRPDAEACITCHGADEAGLRMTSPGHARNGVGCLDCHSGANVAEHGPHLLEKPGDELCGSCHELEAARLHLPSAHRESGQRPFACATCHEIHGAGAGGRLQVLGSGGVCLSCHREKSVPYIYPHPPVEVEGCLACHEPHGSTNPRLLTRRSVANLCLECHAGISASHDLTQARYQACQTCHTAVHGSNHDPRLLRE